jgi:8-oxo-dGTP pyrophosphatase MutT (NUDIX family)
MTPARRDWLQSRLGPQFKPFLARWRDQQSEPASRFCDLSINGEHFGHLDKQHLPAVVAAFDAACIPLVANAKGFDLCTRANQQELSAALMTVANLLHAQGLVPGWRHEEQLVMNSQGEILATAERALFKTLGLRSRAVHVHVENHKGCVWTGVRSMSKHENPGMLDNLAAGGIASAESVDSTLWRELDEEAGLNSDDFAWIERLPPHELVLSRPLLYGGWHHETVVLFHGQLKPGRRPKNRDGEVSAFQLMTPDACLEAINAWQFTPDAALCCALALATAK